MVSRGYAAAYKVRMDEAAAPHGCYTNFDAFFTRSLREGIRPIAPSTLVSPCDGRVSALGSIDEGARVSVKGQHYEVADLLGDAAECRQYVGGQFAVIYLSPRDYHRVHSPIDGQLSRIRAMPGDFFPVNSVGERLVPQLLVRNRRVAFCMESVQAIPITLVMVGALIVGKITANALGNQDVAEGLHQLGSPLQVKKGDEVGAFHLGSTVVLLVGRGISLTSCLGRVTYGQLLSKEES